MQDYTNLPLYLPPSAWSKLMSKDLTFQAKASVVASFGAQLGLRNASETTSQMITSLLLNVPGGADLVIQHPSQLHQLFLVVKREFRAATQVPPVDGLPHVDKLPTNFRQLDERWLSRALGEETIGHCPVSLAQVATRACTIPMRNTNKLIYETKSSGLQIASRWFDMGCAVGQMNLPSRVVAQPTMQPLTSPSAIQDDVAAAPALPLPRPAEPPAPVAAESEALTVASTLPGQTALSAASMLQEQWKTATQSDPQQPEAATAGTDTPDLEGPAKSQKKGETKPATPKVPNISAKKSKQKSVKSLNKKVSKSRAQSLAIDRKHRLDAGIPKKLLQRFSAGCGRCRNRPWCTKSCWANRGFNI